MKRILMIAIVLWMKMEMGPKRKMDNFLKPNVRVKAVKLKIPTYTRDEFEKIYLESEVVNDDVS